MMKLEEIEEKCKTNPLFYKCYMQISASEDPISAAFSVINALCTQFEDMQKSELELAISKASNEQVHAYLERLQAQKENKLEYSVAPIVCDYGLFEDGELKLIFQNSRNANLVKTILDKDKQNSFKHVLGFTTDDMEKFMSKY